MLVWIDCEMTGLDLAKDCLLEVACIITNDKLETKCKNSWVIHRSKSVLEQMNEWCIQHHGDSGLTLQVMESQTSVEQVEQELLQMIKTHCPLHTPIAGNTVHMDLMFIRQEMPKVAEYLHYRVIDVTTLKELA